MADITMPQLGETVTEGTITRWLKAVGDQVAEDEVLFEVSTDKVDSEVPSPSSGYLTEILVPEGETVDVGTKLAVISDVAPAGGDGAAAGAAPAPAAAEEAPPAPPAPAQVPVSAEAPPSPAGTPDAAPEPVPVVAAQPVERAAAAEGGPGPGRGVAAAAPEDGRGVAAVASGDGGGPAKVLSPVVRRLIADYHLDASQITGTGAGGRVTRNDVLGFIDRQSVAGGGKGTANGSAVATGAAAPASVASVASVAPPGAAPAAPAVAATPAAPAVAATPAAPVGALPEAGERDSVVPFTNIRRRTAEHMVRSKHISAHTMVAVEVDYSAVEKARAAAKARFKEQEGISLTYLPFVSRAVVDALAEWPHVNSSVGDDQLIVHNYVNLGIAVDLNFEGLLVPVIHDAEGKRLRQLAREVSSLATKARAKKLTMDDISGGTFTITNAGPFGTLITVPVINQPQVAILSTDGVRKRPVVVELPDGSDSIAIHPMGNLVMSWDHRAFDGAYASAFLAAVKEILETRDWAAEL